jgi:hypothetical protein
VTPLAELARRLRGRALALARREPVLPWLGLLWALALLVRGHLPFIARAAPVSVDEGYLQAFAQRMLAGHFLPYVDAFSHRGPVLYWLGALVAAFGQFSFLPMRIAAVLVFAGIAVLTFLCGRRAGFPLAGALGALAVPFATVLMLDPKDGIALNGEPVLDLFAMAATLAMICAVDRGGRPLSRRWAAAAGALAMLGALSKQVGVVMLGPLLVWLLAAVVADETIDVRQRGRVLLAFIGAAVAPVAALVLLYAVIGKLGALVFWVYRYNVDIYMFPFRGTSRAAELRGWLEANRLSLTLAAAALAWCVGLVAPLRGRRLAVSVRAAGFPVTVALATICAFFGAKAAYRDWGHYFVQVVPWVGLLVGVVAEGNPAVRPEQRPGRSALLCALVLGAIVVSMEIQWPPIVARNTRMAAGSTPNICRTIHAHSRTGDRILVWGFWTELYTQCERKPASRYVFSTPVAGVVPWFFQYSKEEEDRLAVPGSRQQLIADLEQSRAPVIVDASQTMGGRVIRRYGPLADYLDQHYYRDAEVEGAEVYLRGKKNRRLLFDFEAGGLAGWYTSGTAFTDGISTGTRPGQAAVTGQQGSRFLTSFAAGAGDGATGSATSPEFVIDRSRLALLVGGGAACAVSLRVDDRTVLSVTGANREQLAETVWDVSAFRGKRAQLVFVDDATAPWGHLSVDRIELFDAEP